MTAIATCLLCGLEDRDVAVGLVEIPEAERRIVRVWIPATAREGAVDEPHDVRERYAAMPRCADARACAERVRAIDQAAAVTVPAPVIEEGPAWLD